MFNIEEFEEQLTFDTNDLLLKYDKMISKLENEMYNEYFSNISSEKLTGEIEIPLVFKQDCDYDKISRCKKETEDEIRSIETQLVYPDKYIIGHIMDKVKGNYTKEVKDEVIKFEMKEEIAKRQKNILFLQSRLKLIDEQPKYYLRYAEFYNGDFSSLDDENLIKDLNTKKQQLIEARQKRQLILNSLRKAEAKEKDEDNKTLK